MNTLNCEIPKVSESKSMYNIEIKFFSHLYQLHKKLPIEDNTVKILSINNYEGDIEELYDTSNDILYKGFGYYFIDETNTKEIVKLPNRYLIVVPESETRTLETFIAYVQEMEIKTGYVFTDVIFEVSLDPKEEEEYETRSRYLTTLSEAYKNVMNRRYALNMINSYYNSANTDYGKVEYDLDYINRVRIKGVKFYNTIDLSERLVEITLSKMATYTGIVNDLCRLIEEIASTPVNMRNIYFTDFTRFNLDAYEVANVSSIYIGIAAYLNSKYGYSFYISDLFRHQYYELHNRLVGKEYNTLNNYLRFIADPIDIGISVINDKMYIQNIDIQKLQSEREKNNPDYNITMRMFICRFKEEEAVLDEKETTRLLEFGIEDIEIVDYWDIFDLTNKDTKIALENESRLHSVFTALDRKLRKDNLRGLYNKDTLLDVTNCTFLRYNGVMYLGYLENISGKYPYKMYPTVTNYAPFELDFDVNRLFTILPASVVFNFDVYILKSFNTGRTPKGMYKLPESALGIVAFLVHKPYHHVLGDDILLTVDQLGVWSDSTSKIRGYTAKKLVKSMSSLALRRSNIISSYGGVHPSRSREIYLRNTSWKES